MRISYCSEEWKHWKEIGVKLEKASKRLDRLMGKGILAVGTALVVSICTVANTKKECIVIVDSAFTTAKELNAMLDKHGGKSYADDIYWYFLPLEYDNVIEEVKQQIGVAVIEVL